MNKAQRPKLKEQILKEQGIRIKTKAKRAKSIELGSND